MRNHAVIFLYRCGCEFRSSVDAAISPAEIGAMRDQCRARDCPEHTSPNDDGDYMDVYARELARREEVR